MEFGKCKLCELEKDIVESHFLPAAAYKALYADGLSVNEPMVMTGKSIFQSSKQIKTHALCQNCEDILNRSGETWVLDKLATLEGFPLRDLVLRSSPAYEEPGAGIYWCDQVEEIKIEKLVHFALGIFWKAAAITWQMREGPLTPIKFGPYLEPLRQFVHGDAPFPKYMHLILYVDSIAKPLIAMTPPRKYLNDRFHLFVFYVHGIQCSLCVGKRAREDYSLMCSATSQGRPVYLMPDIGNRLFDIQKPYTKQAVLSKGITKTFLEWQQRRAK